MSRRGRIVLKAAVWVACLTPLAALVWWYWTDRLGANPISLITNTLGDWTLRFLLTCLALTPLRILTGWGWQMTLRRLLGLFVFFYACLHFSVWIVLDNFFDWAEMGTDIAKRPYITVGVTALTLLIPLAVTSTTGMIRRLGARAWKRLHRLVFVTGVLGVLHYIWLAKKVLLDPWIYAVVLVLLLGIRAWDAARRLGRRRAAAAASRPSGGAGSTRTDESPASSSASRACSD